MIFSFKERGARYALLKLSDEEKKIGVISASLGNHALGLSYHAFKLGIPCTVIMPLTAPIMKIQKCRNFNAEVLVQVCLIRTKFRSVSMITIFKFIFKGATMAEAKRQALFIAKERRLTYINGYDHPNIIAGQGTIGLEICEQVDSPDAVVIPVGGGGLIAGVATAIKAMNPSTKIIVSLIHQSFLFMFRFIYPNLCGLFK